MTYYIYILFSNRIDHYYKGHTKNLNQRLSYHNNGYEKTTKFGVPWEMVWYTEKASKSETQLLEYKFYHILSFYSQVYQIFVQCFLVIDIQRSPRQHDMTMIQAGFSNPLVIQVHACRIN